MRRRRRPKLPIQAHRRQQSADVRTSDVSVVGSSAQQRQRGTLFIASRKNTRRRITLEGWRWRRYTRRRAANVRRSTAVRNEAARVCDVQERVVSMGFLYSESGGTALARRTRCRLAIGSTRRQVSTRRITRVRITFLAWITWIRRL